MITDHLPDWMSTYVQETAAELQVPVDAVALLSIGALSAAVNGGATTLPVDSWAEPCVLYTLALLASGEGKSPAFTKLLEPVVRAFEEVTGVHQATDAKTQTIRNRINRKHIKKVEADALRAVAKGSMSLEEAIAEVAAAERAVALFNNTNIPLKVVTDVTPAGLLDALQDNNGRVVIASPEAESLMSFRGGSKEAILKGFDGETLTQGRRGTGEVTIGRPTITAMLAMQPAILGSLGADMVNRGLMPRFLISYPESMVGHREARTVLVSPEAEAEYEAEMTRIVNAYSEPRPKLITWNPDAKREIGTWRTEIEPLLAPDGLLASIAAWGSKVRGAHFIRLAALLAIANGRDFVNIQDCYEAKAILRALMIDAKRAFGAMGASFSDDDVVHLMSIVERLPERTFAKRMIMRRSNRLKTPDRAGQALDRAVEEGLLTYDEGTKQWTYVE